MSATWREAAAPIISRVLAENKGKSDFELKRALRVAYPFGQRQYHPYKIWLDEIAVQTGKKKLSKRQKAMQIRAPEPPDERQAVMFDQPIK